MTFDAVDCVNQVAEQGYAIVRQVIGADCVAELRNECDAFCNLSNLNNDLVTSNGCIVEPTSLGPRLGKTLLPAARSDLMSYLHFREHILKEDSSGLVSLLQSEGFKELVNALLGDCAYLFNEQFVVKPPCHNNSAFPWHQDGAFLLQKASTTGEMCIGYYSLWISLDHTNHQNGGLQVLPYGQPIPHESDEPPSFRCDPGDVIVLSHDVFHKSPANLSQFLRRAYLIQFSQLPILDQGFQSDNNSKHPPEDILALHTSNFEEEDFETLKHQIPMALAIKIQTDE